MGEGCGSAGKDSVWASWLPDAEVLLLWFRKKVVKISEPHPPQKIFRGSLVSTSRAAIKVLNAHVVPQLIT